MAYTKTNWVDHVVSRPNTYTQTVNQDNTVTLAPAGTVEQQGTPVNAENLNHMETGIADAHSAVSDLSASTETALGGKQDKEDGKGLSSNDFTNAYKEKLDNVDTEVTEDSEDLITSGAVFAALAGANGEDINALKAMVFPKLILTGTASTDFTLTKGQTVIEGTISAGGSAEVLIPELGTWTVSWNSYTKIVDILAPMTLNECKIKVLDEYTWAEIAAISESGQASSIFDIGDEKDITVNGETITLQIADFAHDDLTAGGKAGITFITKNLMTGAQKMNSTNTNSGGFTGSAMYTYLNTTLYNLLPSGLKSAIKAVNKKTSAGNKSTTINTDSMKLFLLSEIEVFGTTTYSVSGEGSQYPIFTDAASRTKKLSNGSGSAYPWWERSPDASNSPRFCYVTNSGGVQSYVASLIYGVCYGFCV